MISTIPASPPDTEFAQFKAALYSDGLQGALKFLNQRTAYRYTAIYRLDGSAMRTICLYDRLGQDTASLESVPLTDSFCQFVMADDGFRTADSSQEPRLAGHRYQGVLNAYFGLPLSREPGTIYGTFCHFDFDSQNIADSEVPFLESIRPLLMPHLP